MKKLNLFLLAVGILLGVSGQAKSIPVWWNVNPSDGSTVEELGVIKIDNGTYSDTFRAEEGVDLLINGNATPYTVSYESNNGYPDDTIVITLATPITTNGRYNINVPAGFFTYLYYGEDLSVSEMFEWDVTVKNSEDGDEDAESFETSIPAGFNVNPADGETVKAVTALTISDGRMEYESFSAKSDSFKIIVNGKGVEVNATTTDSSITLTLQEPLTETGVYNIEVPAGVFTYENMYWDVYENSEFKWVVNIKETTSGDDNPSAPEEPENTTIPSGFKVTPPDGANVENLSVITISNSILGDLAYVEGSKLYINGKSVGFVASIIDDDETLEITLDTLIDQEGEYSIFLPKGFFTYYGDLVSSDFKWVISIGETGSDDPVEETPDAVIPTNFEVTPANGSKVDKIAELVIESTRLGEIGLVEDSPLYINGNNVKYTATVTGDDDEILTLTLADTIMLPGEYEINLPAGFFTFYGDTFQSGEFKWTVWISEDSSPVDPNPGKPDEPISGETYIPTGFHVSPEPDSEVDKLNKIIVTTDYSDISVTNELNYILINDTPVAVSATANWDTMVITLDEEITATGEYTIVIPAGSFRWADTVYEDSEIFVFTIKVNGKSVGVDEINTEDDIEVYDVNGMRVDNLRSNHLYIIRKGEKVYKVINR